MVSLAEGRSGVTLDDHPVWLSALELILDEVGIDVVGAATSAEAALVLLDEKRPDLFLADLELNGGGVSGAACIREALERFPDLTVIVVSGFDDPASIEKALSAGAVAFVSKAADAEDLASTVRQVFSPSVFLPNDHRSRVHRLGRQSKFPGLTRREADILDLVAEGHSNRQVGQMLWVTEQTVKFHLSNIYRKLQVANRTEASRWAQLNGLLSSGSTRQAAVPSTAA